MPSFSNDKEKKRERQQPADVITPGGPPAAEGFDRGDVPAAAVAEINPSPDLSAEQIQRLLAEKQELTNTLVRRQADFENYRKRMEKERHQERHRGVESLIEQILPVVDAIDRALDSPSGGAGAEYRKGFELVRRQLWDALAKQGLTRIESVGKEFNPHFHHAIERVETTDHADGIVVMELQPGYVFHERVLRPAMVRVASEPASKTIQISKPDN